MRALMRALIGALLLALPAAAQAQRVGDQLAGGGYAAIVWNESRCTVTVSAADADVPPGREALLRLAPMAATADAPPPREVRVDGSLVLRLAGDTHLEVMVRDGCKVEATPVTRATLIANTEVRIRHLEFLRSEARGGLFGGGFSRENRARLALNRRLLAELRRDG